MFISHYIHLVVKNAVFIAVLVDELFDRKMDFFSSLQVKHYGKEAVELSQKM